MKKQMTSLSVGNIIAEDIVHNDLMMLRKGVFLTKSLVETLIRRGYTQITVMDAEDFKDIYMTVSDPLKAFNQSDLEKAAAITAKNFAKCWNLSDKDAYDLELACALYSHDYAELKRSSFIPAHVSSAIKDINSRIRNNETKLTTMIRIVVAYTKLHEGTATKAGYSHEVIVKALMSHSFEYDEVLIKAIA